MDQPNDQPIAIYRDLAGKTVFISGGATGIGRDLVIAFAQQDALVIFADINAPAGNALCTLMKDKDVHFINADVTDDDALKAALETAEKLGGLDILVNNAANDTRMAINDVDAAAWTKAVDVNLRHQFFAAQYACKVMKPRGKGSIVNFGSVAPEMMVPELSVYSACKAAIRGLTRSIARDMGPFGIRANTILPGCILTERQRQLWFRDQATIDAAVAQQCLPRELCGRDVAEMALFLASDVSAACTAQDFIVDAGMI